MSRADLIDPPVPIDEPAPPPNLFLVPYSYSHVVTRQLSITEHPMSSLLLTVHLLQPPSPPPQNRRPKPFHSKFESLKMRIATLFNFSLLSLASAQTSSWGEPFTVDNDASTQNLLATSADLAPAPTITDEFSVSIPTELMSSSSFSVSLSSPSGSGTTVSTPLTSSPSSGRTSQSSASGSGGQVQSTAAAAPVGVDAFQKKLGVAGVLAGAAGVLFV
jgi:hypothetical protein